LDEDFETYQRMSHVCGCSSARPAPAAAMVCYIEFYEAHYSRRDTKERIPAARAQNGRTAYSQRLRTLGRTYSIRIFLYLWAGPCMRRAHGGHRGPPGPPCSSAPAGEHLGERWRTSRRRAGPTRAAALQPSVAPHLARLRAQLAAATRRCCPSLARAAAVCSP
jgi:hypothetical protein